MRFASLKKEDKKEREREMVKKFTERTVGPFGSLTTRSENLFLLDERIMANPRHTCYPAGSTGSRIS